MNRVLSDDVTADLLGRIGRIPVLTAEEEVELARTLETGVLAEARLADSGGALVTELEELAAIGRRAFDTLFHSNLRLVASIGRRFLFSGIPLADLVHEGSFGLDRAIRGFDYRRGYKFSTYAANWIRASIADAVHRGAMIRLPVNVQLRARASQEAELRLTESFGRRPTHSELAQELGLSPIQLTRALEAPHNVIALESPVNDLGYTVGDSLGIELDLNHNLEVGELARSIVRAFDSLSELQRLIVDLQFGLSSREPLTTVEISSRLGLSRHAVSHHFSQAMETLRCDPGLQAHGSELVATS